MGAFTGNDLVVLDFRQNVYIFLGSCWVLKEDRLNKAFTSGHTVDQHGRTHRFVVLSSLTEASQKPKDWHTAGERLRRFHMPGVTFTGSSMTGKSAARNPLYIGAVLTCSFGGGRGGSFFASADFCKVSLHPDNGKRSIDAHFYVADMTIAWRGLKL